MPFVFNQTEIEDIVVIKPHMYPDDRGLYKKYYKKTYSKRMGLFVSLPKVAISTLRRAH